MDLCKESLRILYLVLNSSWTEKGRGNPKITKLRESRQPLTTTIYILYKGSGLTDVLNKGVGTTLVTKGKSCHKKKYKGNNRKVRESITLTIGQ